MKTYKFQGVVVGHRVNRDFSSTFNSQGKIYKDLPSKPTSTVEFTLEDRDWPMHGTIEVDGILSLGALATLTIDVQD